MIANRYARWLLYWLHTYGREACLSRVIKYLEPLNIFANLIHVCSIFKDKSLRPFSQQLRNSTNLERNVKFISSANKNSRKLCAPNKAFATF